ncbi:centromere protein F isoform X1 [Rhinoderma darwinii]|uniref:centromere protein F isoform X1 n=1 Tax=Rhinoderma darwinii TaxID=43563 RepID=UPI003F67AFE2
MTEQKLKKVSEELSCQRQNGESARLALETKLKEQEKENQQELLRQQNSLKNMEQQLNQMKTKLSQESQQAKNEFNSVQSELDRATHGKKILEHEVEDLKQKLSRSEQAASTSQNHMTDLKRDLEEARSQQNAIKSQLDHKMKEVLKLEDEFRSANQTLRQNQAFIDELKNKNNSLEVEMKAAVQKLNNEDSTCLENLKVTMINLEKERDFAKDLLQKRENDLADVKNAHAKMSEELSTLKTRLHCKEQELKDLTNWKNEYENNSILFSKEKENMSIRTKDLEVTVQSLTDQVTLLENDKKNLHTQIKTLQDIIDVRTADLEVQEVNCRKLNSQLMSESEKYQKEIENLQKISELEAQNKTEELNVWSNKVSYLEGELEKQGKLNAELQGQLDLLLRSHQEIQKHLSEVKGKHECRIPDSTSLKDHSSEQSDSIPSIIREKEEEEIVKLSEKCSVAKAEMESVYQNNTELTTKLQELNLLSETWSAERETLAASISSLQKDLEKLTEENKRMGEHCDLLSYEKTQLQNAKIDTSEKDFFSNHNAEDKPVDESREETANRYENLKEEVAEWKEKVSRTQQENSRLLRANEELSTSIGKLRDNEFSLNKTLEELRVCLKDKEASLGNAHTKLELLNKNCREKDHSVEGVREHLIDLQSPSNDGFERNDGAELTKVSQDGSESPKGTNLHGLDETTLNGSSDGILMNNSLFDISGDISFFTPSVGQQNRDENLTLLINMDHLTLVSASDPTLPLPDLSSLESQKSATLSPFTSPPIKRADGNGDRKSITSQIVDLLLQQSPPQQQQVLSSGVKIDEPVEMKDLLVVYQMELSRLQKQHLSEIATWQQKLKDQASEMETVLSAGKAEAERLAQELEAARLELQVFDLSARSLLSFDNNDDSTTRFDATNQTLCTVLPIGRLSLGNNALQTSGCLTQSPKVAFNGVVDSITEMIGHGSPTGQVGNIEKCSRERKRRKGSSGAQVDNLETQDVSESLQLKTKEREEINQDLLMEIKDLSAQIEILKGELLKKDREKQDLDDKSKVFEVEKLELLEKVELISSEKSQLANKIVELEKELNNSLNAMEILKRQVSEVSSIRENLEISGKECKENYLQTQIELRRAKSEKSNLENHALSLEADLDALHSKCQRLQEESEGNLRSFNEARENLDAVVEAKYQLIQELESLVEEKEELEQMYKKLQVTEQELESSKLSSKELIKILEADLRTLKEELQAVKLTAEELTAERDCMVDLQENEKTQVRELQNQIQKFQEEEKILVREQEDLQIQVRTTQAENEKLSRALERCQQQKHELGSSLSSAQEEVTLMRTGIEKLKVKIEADEKKKRHSMEKLKESERKFDKLNDKIESLERELIMSEENLETAIMQTETAKEEAEKLKEQKDTLEMELKCLGKKLEDLEEELQSSRDKMVEFEATIATVTKTLESGEMERAQFMEDSKKQQESFQVELEELLAQKALSDQKYETAVAECADITSKMKEQLLQELEKAQMASKDFEMSLQKLTSEQEECKLQLDEKTRQLVALESQSKDSEQWEIKYSAEISRFEVECENLKNKNKSLQKALEELEEKVQAKSAENETLQSTIADLKTSCCDLETQVESTKSEKQTLLDKVAELEDDCCGLQSKLQDADLQIKSIQELNCRERRGLDEEMQAIRRQHQDGSVQLLTAMSEAAEMKKSVASLQRELESQAKKHEDYIIEYEERLLQEHHRDQSLLDDIRKRDGDQASDQEKLTSLETHLNAHKQQIDRLKAGNGELNESLCKAQEQLVELKQLKVVLHNLKRKNAKTCKDLSHWMNSCKEMEEEKQQLQRQIFQQEETLKGQKHHATEMNTSDNDLLSEIEELKQCLEEKTSEADESVEKYCNLLIKTHKLEDSNDTLRTQLDLLSSRLKERESKKDQVETQTSQSEGAVTQAKKSRTSRRSTQRKKAAKRQRESETTEQNPSTPQVVSKRVKKTGSPSLEDAFKPEGLPDVVKKGFADIPSGKQSPFVLRRTAVPLRRSPRLSSHTNSPSVMNTRIDNLENISDLNSPTPGGSKFYMTKATEGDSAPMDVLSPLSANVKMKSRPSDDACAGELEKERANIKASHDETEEEGSCQVQ